MLIEALCVLWAGHHPDFTMSIEQTVEQRLRFVQLMFQYLQEKEEMRFIKKLDQAHEYFGRQMTWSLIKRELELRIGPDEELIDRTNAYLDKWAEFFAYKHSEFEVDDPGHLSELVYTGPDLGEKDD